MFEIQRSVDKTSSGEIGLDIRTQIQVGSRSVALRRVFDLKLRGDTSDRDNSQSLGY